MIGGSVFYEPIVNLLLPPVGFLLLLVLGCLFAVRRCRLAAWLIGAGTIGLLLAATPIVPDTLTAWLEDGIDLRIAPPDAKDPPQAIVILGGTFRYGQEDGAVLAGAQLGGLSAGRLRAGAELQQRTNLPVLLSGGTVTLGKTLAQLMVADLVAQYRITPRWVDAQSLTTWENAEDSAALLRRDGIDSVYVVTDAWHMRRAMIAFRRVGLKVWPAPVLHSMPPRFSLDGLMPRPGAWMDTYYAVHEWLGCLVYALRG